jgi:hypothetical protein
VDIILSTRTMTSASYTERVHYPLSYDSHAAHTYYFLNNIDTFVFVMLCKLCSLSSWEPKVQILQGIILGLKYLKYIYVMQNELSRARGGAVGGGTEPQVGRARVRIPMVLLEFLFT